VTALIPKLDGLAYGGDYNPEQWPEEVWVDDVRLMKDAGVNLVTVGVFSWSMLEPAPGEYEFGWLDRVMDLLDAGGIRVDLATATASPPPWLAARHPESLPVTNDGRRLWPGSRQHFCPTSAAYLEAAVALAHRLAEHYRDHPALAMWHINNEYGCHVCQCFCDACASAFRRWLEDRYGKLADLNEVWGTSFWSQRYGLWEEIQPPRLMPYTPNPGQLLDYQRFSSDAFLNCFESERAVLAELTPGVPITTNFMGFFKPLDYWKWAAREDIVSHDVYPDPSDPDAPVEAAMTFDLMRSLGGGRPWLLMEQVTSQVNWRNRNALKPPGLMRLWTHQAVARGSDGAMFFQWRQSQYGAEKFHGAVIQHAGEDTRVWREVVALGRELQTLRAVGGTRSAAEVAIVFDWDNWWALEQGAKPTTDLKLLDQVRSYYRPLHRTNVAVDFVMPEADLARYRLVCVPNLYLVRDGVGEAFEDFISDGGTLVMSFFSGIVDANDRVRLPGYPAPFRRLLGMHVEEFDPLALGQVRPIVSTDGRRATAELWSDVIHLEGAEAIAVYDDGLPAVTRHRFGRGLAYWVGTRPEPAFMSDLLRDIRTEAGISAVGDGPDGVELVRRFGEERSYLFALNHTSYEVRVPIRQPVRSLLGESPVGDEITIGPYGVAVLEEDGR